MKLELDRKILLDALRRVSFVGAPATRLDSDGSKLVATAAVSTCAARATVYLKPNANADAKLGDSVATNGSGNRDRAETRAGSRAVAAATAAVSTCAVRATVAASETPIFEKLAVAREVVRFLAESNAKRVAIETNDDGSTLFVADGARVRSRSPETLDFPDRPLIPVGCAVHVDEFRAAVYAASSLARRAVGSSLAIETVRFDVSKGGEFAVVGTDGRALSVRLWTLAGPPDDRDAIVGTYGTSEPFGVDARLAARIASAFGSGLVSIRFRDGFAYFNGSETLEVAATTTDGRFPDWRKVVPEKGDRVVCVDREKLLRVVRAASATADEKRRVSLRFDANGLTATCVGAEIGTSEVVEPFDGGNGDVLSFDVDPENLRFLESWSAPSVEISSSDPVKPFRVASPDGRELAAVMPLT